MLVSLEGVDAAEIIVRPHPGAGWRIEFPHAQGSFVTVVSDQAQALRLAGKIRPGAPIRLLPARE